MSLKGTVSRDLMNIYHFILSETCLLVIVKFHVSYSMARILVTELGWIKQGRHEPNLS